MQTRPCRAPGAVCDDEHVVGKRSAYELCTTLAWRLCDTSTKLLYLTRTRSSWSEYYISPSIAWAHLEPLLVQAIP